MFRFGAETFESDFSMDDYAKDGGPELVWFLYNFTKLLWGRNFYVW